MDISRSMQHLKDLVDYLHSKHNEINFTFEMEIDRMLSFVDIYGY